MVGRLFDLASTDNTFSQPTILDSNVVIAWQAASFQDDQSPDALRALAFVRALATSEQHAILPPTAYSETVHATIKAIYQRPRSDHRSALTARYGRQGGFTWRDL